MMNLSTHTAYPEVHINPSHAWAVVIYTRAGEAVAEFSGQGDDDSSARAEARAAVDSVSSDFLKPAEGTE